MKNRLPRGWKYWCIQLGLRSEWKGYDLRDRYHWYYLKGKGRHWRVTYDVNTDELIFQAGELYEEFDRWSNSVLYTFSMPQCKAELQDYIKTTIGD